ncbi:TPA: hypothetical protein OGU99_000393 [Escherichia coli]|nr:hypothetical protein [Escherichia coli O157]HCQ0858467.1 hypothetical protein [Escherichia coli]
MAQFTYVSGSSAADYKLGKIISNPRGVKGQSRSPQPPNDPSGEYFYTYDDVRPFYGIKLNPNAEIPKAADEIRKREGFWWLEYVSVGDRNSKGEYLEYRKIEGDAVVTFNETEVAPYAALTAVKTQTYIDMDLADVKADLKQRTAYERDNLINSGYHYKNADGTVDVTFPSDVNGRQMLNNYYTQAINGSQTINIYLDSGEIVTVDGDEMVEIFNGLLAQIDGYFNDAIAQQTAIDAATTIFDAQKAATFVYPDQSKIPVRN